MSYLRTAILLAAMTALFMGVGFLIGGQSGMVIAFLVAAAMNLFAYWNSDKMVLRMYGAREVDARSAPELYDMVSQLAPGGGSPDAEGVHHGEPAAERLRDRPQSCERRGGGHHRADADAGPRGARRGDRARARPHQASRHPPHDDHRDDCRRDLDACQFRDVLFGGRNDNNGAGIFGTLALVILAPLAAALVQMGISRTREYEADRIGAEISRQPLLLASALQKISRVAERVPNLPAEQNPASAHLFIVNPLSGRADGQSVLDASECGEPRRAIERTRPAARRWLRTRPRPVRALGRPSKARRFQARTVGLAPQAC